MRARLSSWSPLLAALAVAVVVLGLAFVVRPGARGGPPPLSLTGAGSGSGARDTAGDAALAPDAASSHRSAASSQGEAGIGAVAPPIGGGFTVDGDLPKGPGAAPIFRLSDEVSRDRVRALAESLGLAGAPRREGQNWAVRSGTAVLRVSTLDGNQWTYARDEKQACLPLQLDPSAGPDSAVSCSAVAVATPGTPDGRGNSGSPAPAPPVVTASKALEVAAPVFAALGLEAKADDVQPGSPATVAVDPTVAGLPTHGAATLVTVDGNAVQWASGWLGSATAGDRYPVVPAKKALDQVSALPQPLIAIDCAAPADGGGREPAVGGDASSAGSAGREPAVGGDASSAGSAGREPAVGSSESTGGSSGAGGEPAVGGKASAGGSGSAGSPGAAQGVPEPAIIGTCGSPKPIVIVGADFGLSMQRDADGPLFVPAWLFRVKGWPGPMPMIAVDPKYLKQPGSSGGNGSDGGGSSGGSTGAPGSIEPAPATGKPAAAPAKSGRPEPAATPAAWRHWRAVDATTLRIQLGAGLDGVCASDVEAMAKETSEEVYVLVVANTAAADVRCARVGRTVDVSLAESLGTRAVIDAATGEQRAAAS